ATILSDGCRLPDSKCPTYGVELLIRQATSSCVRSSSLRRLLIISPKSRALARAIEMSDLPFPARGALVGRVELFSFNMTGINIRWLSKTKQTAANDCKTRRPCADSNLPRLLYNLLRFCDFDAFVILVWLNSFR